MNISIFGLGYVGCVSMGCLAKIGHKVIGVDINALKVQSINKGKSPIIESYLDKFIFKYRKQGRIEATMDVEYAINHSDVSMICVGTPSTLKGNLNLNEIMKVAKEIGDSLKDREKNHIIVVRSTVDPGTCEKVANIISKISHKKNGKGFSVICNPEFLREGSAVKDYNNPPYTLIGSDNDLAKDKVAEIYRDINAEIIYTDIKTAEIIKYVNNSFHALKVAFGNEIGNICKALGINSKNVMDIFVKDTHLNISPYYFKPGFAYGGVCLPKDLKALKTISNDENLITPVINSIELSNKEQINRAKEILNKYHVNNIAILGISFKSGSDDIRNSPIIDIVEFLIGIGKNIKIFDRNVSCRFSIGTNEDYFNEKNKYFEGLMYDDIDETCRDSEMIIVGNKDRYYVDILKKYNGIIFDLCYIDPTIIKKKKYFGINW